MSEAQVVQGIMDSPEYQNEHSDSTFVQDLYFNVLGRATSSEVSSGVTALNGGETRDTLESSVINGSESLLKQIDGIFAAAFHRLQTDPNTTYQQELVQGVSASLVEAGILSDPLDEFFGLAQASVSPAP
jgi:hypothetical protein